MPRIFGCLSRSPAAALLLLGLGTAASADTFLRPMPPCSPCYQPYFGYYGTCWRPWPPGWVNCPCQPGVPTAKQSDSENIPGRPRAVPETKNGQEPEVIPVPPRPEPNQVYQGRGFYLMRLLSR